MPIVRLDYSAFFSHVSETLVLVSKATNFLRVSYGLSFLFFGEVLGTRETIFNLDWEKVFFCL